MQRGAAFTEIYVTMTGTSTDKTEALGDIKKEHLVFKYAESYDLSPWTGKRKW